MNVLLCRSDPGRRVARAACGVLELLRSARPSSPASATPGALARATCLPASVLDLLRGVLLEHGSAVSRSEGCSTDPRSSRSGVGVQQLRQRFFVMNFFRINFLSSGIRHGLAEHRFARLPTMLSVLVIFLVIGLGYGIWTTGAWPWPELQPSQRTFAATLLTVSILHFWYDGFIWSVRKGQVR
jgi:hypothetical protein